MVMDFDDPGVSLVHMHAAERKAMTDNYGTRANKYELAKAIRTTHRNVDDLFKKPWAEGVRAASKCIALTFIDNASWDPDYTSDDFLRDCEIER